MQACHGLMPTGWSEQAVLRLACARLPNCKSEEEGVNISI
jgi:hypothetical protein